MKELIKAAAARRYAQAFNNQKETIQLQEIAEQIKVAYNSGEYHISYTRFIYDKVQALLEQKGYVIENYSSQHDGESNQISWGLKK